MAEKKYYWLKMTDQFFEDKAIKKLRKIAGGDTYTIIYLKMLLTAIKQGNKMYFEGIEDDFMEELALELDEDTDNVKVTVSYLKSKGLIEVLGADEILLTQCAEMVGSETDAARRKRLQRDRERNRAIGSDPVPALEEKSEVVVEEKPAKKKAENTIQLFHRLVEDYNISEPVREKMEVWFRYKMERKESYKSRSDNKKGGRVMAGEEKQLVVEETTVVPGKMEFRLISPTESNFLKHIEWNKEELLAAVRSKVALYEGIVYTEETVKTAKNDRAELNNLVKAIDERRKKVKEVINQPYAEFEKELKEITDLIKKQSAEIDEQVKAFETAEKEEKRAKIMEAYEKAVGNLAEILPFSKVFDQRYLNKTCKLESAIADVQKKIEQVKTDLETIESVCGKYKLNAMIMKTRRMKYEN